MSAFALKLIALITMFIDHIGLAFSTSMNTMWLRAIGRISFPLYAFLVAEGCRHTKNIGAYLRRLVFMAIVVQAAFYGVQYVGALFGMANFGINDLNIFFTQSFAVAIIICLQKVQQVSEKKQQLAYTVLGCLVFVAAQLMNPDYGIEGVILILLFYLASHPTQTLLLGAVGIILNCALYITPNSFTRFLNGGWRSLLLAGFALSSLVLIACYNGTPGTRKGRVWFYLAYPASFVVAEGLYLLYTHII